MYPQYYKHLYPNGSYQAVKILSDEEQVYLCRWHSVTLSGKPTYSYICDRTQLNTENRDSIKKLFIEITEADFMACLKEVVSFFVKVDEKINNL